MGARINLTAYSIYKQLGLGEMKSTTMRVLMDDLSFKHLVWILYDILVNVNRLIFLDNFVILGCEIDDEIPIILGRPFLETERALDNVECGQMKIYVNKYEVICNVCKLIKHSSGIYKVSTVDVIDEGMASVSHLICMNYELEFVLANYDEFEIRLYGEVLKTISALRGIQRFC